MAFPQGGRGQLRAFAAQSFIAAGFFAYNNLIRRPASFTYQSLHTLARLSQTTARAALNSLPARFTYQSLHTLARLPHATTRAALNSLDNSARIFSAQFFYHRAPLSFKEKTIYLLASKPAEFCDTILQAPLQMYRTIFRTNGAAWNGGRNYATDILSRIPGVIAHYYAAHGIKDLVKENGPDALATLQSKASNIWHNVPVAATRMWDYTVDTATDWGQYAAEAAEPYGGNRVIDAATGVTGFVGNHGGNAVVNAVVDKGTFLIDEAMFRLQFAAEKYVPKSASLPSYERVAELTCATPLIGHFYCDRWQGAIANALYSMAEKAGDLTVSLGARMISRAGEITVEKGQKAVVSVAQNLGDGIRGTIDSATESLSNLVSPAPEPAPKPAETPASFAAGGFPTGSIPKAKPTKHHFFASGSQQSSGNPTAEIPTEPPKSNTKSPFEKAQDIVNDATSKVYKQFGPENAPDGASQNAEGSLPFDFTAKDIPVNTDFLSSSYESIPAGDGAQGAIPNNINSGETPPIGGESDVLALAVIAAAATLAYIAGSKLLQYINASSATTKTTEEAAKR